MFYKDYKNCSSESSDIGGIFILQMRRLAFTDDLTHPKAGKS